jgi:CheY-like chemotaxis protein
LILAGILVELLTDEGFEAAILNSTVESLDAAVTCIEPDVVLLDCGEGAGYAGSWLDAASLREPSRPIAVIMMTGHLYNLEEAQLGESERSRQAAFAGWVVKPFDVQELLDTITVGSLCSAW